MNFAKIIPLLFCVVYYAAHSSASDYIINYYRTGEACYEEHLKEKGKLNETFQSKSSSSISCELIIRSNFQTLQTNIKNEVNNMFPNQPNETKCLTDEFAKREAVDHILKIDVIQSNRFLSVSDKDTMLEEARSEFKDELKEIADKCLVDNENFIKIFHDQLGIKNETLDAYQHQYCMAKYVVYNNIIQLNNVDTNPHQIDTDSVNCDLLVNVERFRIENDLTNTLIGIQTSQKQMDCLVNAFKTTNIFVLNIALKVLYFYFDVPSDVKEEEVNKVQQKLVEFTLRISAC